MSLKHIIMFAAAPVSLAAFASPAAAQGIPVYDFTTYQQALATVTNTATMIDKAKQQITTAENTLSSLQKLTNVNSIAPQLLSPQVRNILPNTSIDASTLLSGDLTKIGSLGSLATSIQSKYALSPSGSDADAAYAQALKDSTGSSAATAAFGENTLNIAQTRMQGLDQLRSQLDTAKDPKDVMDLQARIAVEQAQLQNDTLKMQAIQMAQAGEGNLAITSAEMAQARNAASFYDANTIRK